jgi:hypothetical protein
MTADDIDKLPANEQRNPVETLVNVLLLAAIQKQATHVRVTPTPTGGSVQFWLDGAWHEELSPEPALYIPIVRRLGVMIGVLPPRRGEPWFGTLCMRLGEDRCHYFAVAIDRDDTLHALIELVDELAFKARRQPRPPSPHPYRA